MVPGLASREIVTRSLQRYSRKRVNHRRNDGEAGLTHLLAAVAVVAITFAQQLVRAFNFLAYEAHRRHCPIPLELVGDSRKDKRNRGAAIDRGSLSLKVINQDTADLL